jgi:predicted O-methyltransferase YrrM
VPSAAREEVDLVTFRELLQLALIYFLRKTFGLWELLGIHVTPVHYFQPIPNMRRLDERTWDRRTAAVGIDFRDEAQRAVLAEVRACCEAEYRALPVARTADPTQFAFDNNAFGPVDAEILYGMVRLLKPPRMIEVGSGNSTLLAAQAARANAAAGAQCDFVAIEPYPSRVIAAGVPGVKLRAVEVQSVPLEEFTALGAGDILFIDSTHVVQMGSDVVYDLLEILPRLRPGVYVHLHDIFVPAEYPRRWAKDFRWFWNEQYAVQAFLAFNSAFEVVWSSAHMHLEHPDLLEAAFASYDRKGSSPGSLWLRRVR